MKDKKPVMGRPKTDIFKQRRHPITMYVNEKEKQKIEKKALESGLSVSNFIYLKAREMGLMS